METQHMRKQCVPGPLLSYRTWNEARDTYATYCQLYVYVLTRMFPHVFYLCVLVWLWTVCSLSLSLSGWSSLLYPLLLSLSAVNSTCVFEVIDTKRGSISYPTTCLKAGDELEMKFDSTVTDTFISQIESHLEFIRDTATVTVVQGISVTRYIHHCHSHWVSTIVFIPISCGGGTGKNILQCQ